MKKFIRSTFILAAAATIGLALYLSCGKDSTEPEPTLDNWTILVYSDGNNDLDVSQGNTSYVIEDVQDMQNVGSSDLVNVVAMVSSIKTGGQAKYYHIELYPDDIGDNISSTMLEDLGSKDMSDPQTLRSFLVYGIENYPAQHYMVIIDDHGAGWLGACVDEQNGGGNIMSMVDMDNAFSYAISNKGIGKFDIIAYHCCLMSMVEVAYQLRNCADYLVASEFVMPMESIFGCDEWLGNLVANPATSPENLAKSIVTAVDNEARADQKIAHMAATDLSQMSHLAAKIDNLGIQLRTTATQYWWEVYQAWFSCWNTNYDAPAYIDLRDFVNQIKQQDSLQNINLVMNAADSVIASINDAVVMTKTNAPAVTRGGLTIHMPYLMDMYDSANYARLDFQDVGWTNFLSIYIHGLEPFLEQYTLTVNVSPAGSGTVAKNPDQQTYMQGETVTLTATANSGYTFYRYYDGATYFTSNPFTFNFPAGNVSITAYFTGGGTNSATVSGTVTWPGHSLSNYTYAFADTFDGDYLYLVAQADVNSGTGNYTITISPITTTMTLFIEAQDDVNNNDPWNPDAGDGWGYYDPDDDDDWDPISVSPGDAITDIDIEMSTYTPLTKPKMQFIRQEK